MGQYHVTVNLDKKQYLMPHKLGDGLKLLEQAGAVGGVSDALLLLLAVSNGRGGGDVMDYREYREREGESAYRDPIVPEIVGSWGGDRIAVVGDYAEISDLASEHNANLIYEQIGLSEALRDGSDPDPDYVKRAEEHWYKPTTVYVNGKPEDGPSQAEAHDMSWAEFVAQAKQWRDVSDHIAPVLAKHLGVKLVGTGWKHRVNVCGEHPEKVRGHLDHKVTRYPFIGTRPPRMSESEVDLHLRLGTPPKMLGLTAAQAKARNGGWGNR